MTRERMTGSLVAQVEDDEGADEEGEADTDGDEERHLRRPGCWVMGAVGVVVVGGDDLVVGRLQVLIAEIAVVAALDALWLRVRHQVAFAL